MTRSAPTVKDFKLFCQEGRDALDLISNLIGSAGRLNSIIQSCQKIVNSETNFANRIAIDDSNIDHRHAVLSSIAEKVYRNRRLRDRIFADTSLFGEPAWDILLDLMLAETSGKRLSVSSVCIGSNVPSTTALRWISILEEKGLALREADVNDGRRILISLTELGYRKMEELLSQQIET